MADGLRLSFGKEEEEELRGVQMVEKAHLGLTNSCVKSGWMNSPVVRKKMLALKLSANHRYVK